jgi:proteasome lid subunit RPN8/RPN11
MIHIERGPWREMVNHAQAAYPNECCGAMLGSADNDRKTVVCSLALDNVYEGSQRARFELRPMDLIRVETEARERGLDLLGFYHSHPDCDAYFSETDLKSTPPWPFSYVVLSIRNAQFDHANSWFNIEQSHSEKEELTWPES